MDKFLLLILVLLFGLISFSLLTNQNKKDGFANHTNFMESIKETIFNVTTPYPTEIIQKDISPPLLNFCNVYGNSRCNDLTNENCKSTSCCVLLHNETEPEPEHEPDNENPEKKPVVSNPKCVGGSVNGPTFNSDADSFYYMNKLYPNTPI